MSLITVREGSGGLYNGFIRLPDGFPSISQRDHYKAPALRTKTDAKNEVELRIHLSLVNKDKIAYIFCAQQTPVMLVVRYDEGWIIETVSTVMSGTSIEMVFRNLDPYKQDTMFLNTCALAMKKAELLYGGVRGMQPVAIQSDVKKLAINSSEELKNV